MVIGLVGFSWRFWCFVLILGVGSGSGKEGGIGRVEICPKIPLFVESGLAVAPA